MSEDVDKVQEVLQAYQMTFEHQYGEIVLQDLTEAYHDRLSEAVEEDIENIPHPFRAYYIEGQRSVVLAINAAIEAAKQPQLTTDSEDK